MKRLQKILSVMLSLVLICTAVFIAAPKVEAANPYVPLWEHIPDAEPHLFHDPDNITQKRIYIYGSHDLIRGDSYCAFDIVSWSAPEDNVNDWRYEGPAYTFVRNNNNAPSTLFAPDTAEVKRKVTLKSGVDRSAYTDNQKLSSSDYDDRKYDEYPAVYYDKVLDCGYIFDYYLYPHPNGITWVICHSKGDPIGPYENVNTDANSNKLPVLEDGSPTVNNGFDPGVVVDTDERGYATAAYLWWAGFDTIAACKLNLNNMASAEYDPVLAAQDTTGKYSADPNTLEPITDPTNSWYGVKRNFLPVAGCASYSNVHAWAMENNVNPINGGPKYDILDPENLDLYRIFEASSPRKIGNKWVFAYSAYAGPEYGTLSSNATLKYAYSDNPLGPWKYGGMLVDARGPMLDQNKNMMTTNSYGNTHGGLVEANGQWYIFYHRCINQDERSRQHVAEPVYLKADTKPVADGGSVVITAYDPVTKGPKTLKDVNGNVYTGAEVTSSGMQIEGLNPYQYYSAGYACVVTPERTVTNVPLVPQSDFVTYIQATYDRHEDAAPILNIRDGSIMGFKYFNFDAPKPAGNTTTLDMYITPKGVDTTIDIMMDTPWPVGTPNAGIKLGELSLSKDAKQVKTKYTVSVPKLDDVKGRHGIYFVCRSGNKAQENCQFSGFSIGRDNVLFTDSFASLNNWKDMANATNPDNVLTMANNGKLTSKKGSDWQDYEFTVDIESITGALSIQFMKKDLSNYYELAAADDGSLTLNSVKTGSTEPLVATDTGVFNAPGKISVSAADGVIKAFVDGVPVLRAENDDRDYGAVGFATGAGGTAKINSVLVRTAVDKEVATSAMTIKVDGNVVPLPDSTATTTLNSYTDPGNYDFTYAHENANAPTVTATCSDKSVKISVQQPESATGMTIVRANKGGYTKTFRIMLAKGKTVTGAIKPVREGKAYGDPAKASQDILDDIMAGQNLTGDWRLEIAVMADKAMSGRNGFTAGTQAGVGIYGNANNYYQVSAQRHSTATNVTQVNANASYCVGGVTGSVNGSQNSGVDSIVNTPTYYQMFTYNLRLTKTGNAVQAASRLAIGNNGATPAYANVGSAQTFDATVFDSAKLQFFATNPTDNRDLELKYVATLVTDDYQDPYAFQATSGSITPAKNGKAYGDTTKAADDIKEIDLSAISPEILAGDWAATVTFTATPTLQTSNADIQVGIGMSAGSEPEKNFYEAHMNRNGTNSNNAGGATYVKNNAARVAEGPILTNGTPPTSTMATHVIRLTKIGNTLRGAYATNNATTWANLGGTLATKFSEEFFKNAKLNVFATNGSEDAFATNYTINVAPIKTPMPVSYDQLAVEDAAALIGNGIAVKDTDSGADDKTKAQTILNADAGLTNLGVTCVVDGNGPYDLKITKGAASMTIAPFAALNVTNKDWNAFNTLVNSTIASLTDTAYTAVSWNRLQKALKTVEGMTQANSSELEIGLAYDRVNTAYTALEPVVADTSAAISVDGINDGGHTKADSVSVTVTEASGNAITGVMLSVNGGAASPAGYANSGTPFDITTTTQGEYYIEATATDATTSGFGFIVDKTKPVINYDATAKTVTISDDNLAYITINGQTIAVTSKKHTVALATDRYEVSAEDKAGNIAKLINEPTDKTDLNAIIEVATSKMFADNLVNYTTGSANEYKNALDAAQALSQNPDAKQIDIDQAVSRMDKAINGLVSRVALKAIIAKAEALNLDDYMQYHVRYLQTRNSGGAIGSFLTELENCQMFYVRPNYTQDQIDWAIARMNSAIDALVSRVPLKEALAKANDILGNASGYEQASVAALQTAVDSATKFYNQTTTATAANVTTQVNNLNTAMNNLVRLGDKAALAAAIAKAQAIVDVPDATNIYMAASVTELETALNAAKAVNNDANAVQSEINSQLTNLNAALDALVPKVVTTALDAAIANANTMIETNYTQASWATFKTALDAAKGLGTTATQAQVDAATLALNNAMFALVVDESAVDKPVTKITISGNPTSLIIGKTATLKATVSPSDATIKTVKWSSSDTSVATVNNAGMVTAKKVGKVSITATATDGSNVFQSITITVKNNPVTKITISGNPTNLTMGETVTLKEKVTPTNATNKSVTWSTSNKSVATVSGSGSVTAKGPGTVKITARAADGSGKTASVTITIHRYVTMRIGRTGAIRNGSKTTIDSQGTKPFTIGGRTMVPVRFVAEKMGGKVKYTSDSKPIIITFDGIRVELRLREKIMTVIQNKKTRTVKLDVAAQKQNGRTYVPLRAIGQALGFQVYYDAKTEIIVVNNPKMSTALRDKRVDEGKKNIK